MRRAFAVMRTGFPSEPRLQLIEGGTQCGIVGGKRPVDCVMRPAAIGRLTLHGHASSDGRAPGRLSARAQSSE
jgi:di/tripeptidase